MTINIYIPVKKEPQLGDVKNGWKCIQHFQHHNLWERISHNQASGIKASFPKKTIPNKRSYE